ncbi:MAG: hypothetical protein A2844_02345 [Candidatus Ryanbacteria bacterium RIFCSPHIGHO2_01_FULL_48_80]|nr:MAG: hypothetical protein A2844_02345 [Candidatus Ryanbacteria bacterium RIFCSPHIGHO2_01_FULL_48_80]
MTLLLRAHSERTRHVLRIANAWMELDALTISVREPARALASHARVEMENSVKAGSALQGCACGRISRKARVAKPHRNAKLGWNVFSGPRLKPAKRQTHSTKGPNAPSAQTYAKQDSSVVTLRALMNATENTR